MRLPSISYQRHRFPPAIIAHAVRVMILDLHLQGLSVSAIFRQSGIDRFKARD